MALLMSASVYAALPNACEVKSVAPIVPAVAGFSVSSRDEAVMLFAKPVEGISQIFRFDRRTREERCLTCSAQAGGPAVNRHKGAPAFLPDGERFVLQVEMAQHPFEGAIGGPGPGWFNDVWLASADGERWWNLTRLPSGPTDRYGVLLPEPSPDGKQLAWAELYADDGAAARAKMKRGEPTQGSAPWGRWRIRIADFAQDASGAPQLTNTRTLTLPGATWYETQGWSRDGQFLLFATDANLPTPQAMDLWLHNLRTGHSANLTKTPDAWEEFGDLSPNGKLIAFMSSTCCTFKPLDDKRKLRSELYLTTPDRASTTRLTFFNEPGHAHAKDGPGGSTVTKLRWSRDGTAIYFERPFYGPFGGARGSYLMELKFAGACGAADPGIGAALATPTASAAVETVTATRVAQAPSPFPAQANDATSPGATPAPPPSADERTPRRAGAFAGAQIVQSASLHVGGSERTYRLALPQSTAGRQPLVFAFHGFGDNKDLMPTYSGLDELAARHGAIVVYPQSRPGAWPLVLDWAKPDFAFFDALIDELDKHYGIDRARIYATGMSNGAYFAHLLASQRSNVIAAIAPHSGGLGAVALIQTPMPRKYPVMIIHGATDGLVKVDEARKAKAYYESRGHSVRYVELPGHGHHWARGKGINEPIWRFFAEHPLR